ncbi:allantoinase AllB [Actinophytocola sp. NPDC049390]|uniref:allantoinase AllB n=1 Tax=Actinophytocola sp. NPDC049390 TaxID=3363894 RepID=UPI0037B12891
MDLVLRADAVYTPDGPRPAAVCVRDGRIADVVSRAATVIAREDVDLGDLALLPGLVDTHVHVNEPGRTEWEGFATATAAAAAGGVTTIVDMPLNSLPPTTTAAALDVKRAAAAGQCVVDVGFWGGAVPGNLAELARLHEAGVFGFKCFLSPSGVDEFPPLSWAELDAVLDVLAQLDALLVVHAEDPGELREPGPSYAEFVGSRPDSAEQRAVAGLVERVAARSARAHVLHLSSAATLGMVAEARAAGVRITAETCPHYLTFAAERIPAGATEFKCCPPIRGEANRDGLWAGLAAGVVDCVVSDHSPSPPELKRGGFGEAWGGISSLQLGLPAVWTEARRRGHALSEVVRWMASAPADLVGLARKGRIAPGCDADLVAFAPDDEYVVDATGLRHRHPVTPYDGARLSGVVRRTWLRGGDPTGNLLSRERNA